MDNADRLHYRHQVYCVYGGCCKTNKNHSLQDNNNVFKEPFRSTSPASTTTSSRNRPFAQNQLLPVTYAWNFSLRHRLGIIIFNFMKDIATLMQFVLNIQIHTSHQTDKPCFCCLGLKFYTKRCIHITYIQTYV